MAIVTTPWIGRREVVTGLAAAATSLILPPALARAQSALPPTPRQTEGPFYPTNWQGDVDADLVVVRGEAARALGQVIHIQGRVLDLSGQPVAGAAVEIWQCDSRGIYLHPRDESRDRRRDSGFQGRGRSLADTGGRYRFRTIRPVAYGSRTPHIHFKVALPAGRNLITQMYVFGEPLNARDGVLNGIRDPRQRDSVIVRLEPANGLEAGAMAATFDIVVG
ncbi:protocatechuate 3,4-dioxygenase [Phreatobacter stygius]|uniref:Intradiol ring-cleavage dioxygenase n=1 Tax=Phreatobacter stygius TaxID=1940610 RepID=A0A4D7BDD3_9HYPH|nr:protocatechuate 3,4-dioxygenase [Phreatobacter stygius]QCI67376.1 intradiol ring-cleavage dioxygenase [Phreatobacter stygius]